MIKENKKLIISGALLGVFYIIYQIKRIKQIEIKIKNADIIKLSFKQVEIILNISIKNTSNLIATIKDIQYTVQLNESIVLNNEQTIDQVVHPGQINIVPIKISFKPSDVIKSIGKGIFKKGLELNVDIKTNIKILNINFPFAITWTKKFS